MTNRQALLFALTMVSMSASIPYAVAQTDASPAQHLSLQQPNDAVSLTCVAVPPGSEATSPVQLQRTFLDHFDTPSLSTSLWQTYFYNDAQELSGRTLSNNAEKQIYVDPNYTGRGSHPLGLNPFHQQNGILTIKAQRTPTELLPRLYNYPFTSGVISSRESLKQTYGYFEIRARLPHGKALWPAFWLVEPKQWPPEIDVFEAFDGEHPNQLTMTTHWKEKDTGEHKLSACPFNVPDADAEFHMYGVLWTKERVVYYVDRKPVIEQATPPGLDQPMSMLANLAVEQGADASTPASSSYDINWIAAYRQ